ncbi:MAG: hypothetical protein IJG61_04105, partial [Lachnospiraceae bacterium]|nr:hypothetical protein [Lachnospiraceae bacterium]
ATKAAVRYAKEHGKFITFDPNYRAPLWASEDAAKEQMLWGLAQADMVKMSIEEAQLLWGAGCTEEQAADRLLSGAEDAAAACVFITLGSEGAYFADRNERGYVRYAGGLNVVDTTGAGDIFGGTALAALLDGIAESADGRITGPGPGAAARAAVRACAAASLSVGRPGGISSVPDAAGTETHTEVVKTVIL